MLVEDAGYYLGGDDIYTDGNNKLKYTFTIAGAETDHPAFNAFYKAAEFLNGINFEINVDELEERAEETRQMIAKAQQMEQDLINKANAGNADDLRYIG